MNFSHGQTPPYILQVQRQALERIEACRYCDSIRVAQDSLILSQRAHIVSGDSARVNAERRATARANEAAALQVVVDKDVVILDGEKKKKRFWKWTAWGLAVYIALKSAKEAAD